MLALSFTFPAGRYHATPWGRHVNEGAVAWPPEPWRILRSLISTWHHKVKHTGKHGEITLHQLIESLAQALPEYRLPKASHSHTRHYMPQFAAGKTSLILDAFAAVERDDPLIMVWPNLELPNDQVELLDDLLAVMGYLGRAESWVEARRLTNVPGTNCRPGSQAIDPATGELRGETIALYAALPADEYHRLRQRFLSDKKAQKKLGKTLPESLLEALSVDTADLRKQGWNQPPAARKVSYLRPVDALKPQPVIHTAEVPNATSAVFLLIGKPLPRVEDSLRIGELMRMAVMHAFGKDEDGRHRAPPIFSGHDLPKDGRHRHAFYLPWDSNGDGRLDRVIVHVPDGMNAEQQRVLAKLNRLWNRDGGQWRLVLEGVGGIDVGGVLTQKGTVWQSLTPYLHPWHVKKRFGVEDQLRRECRERGLPEPIGLERLEQVRVGPRNRGPMRFHRFRSKRGLTQPDRHGGFWRLTFAEPIDGPLALGFACHFGLGLFKCIG